MAKEDAAEVDDKKEVFQKILRRRVGHLEKLLKGNWHGLDLLKRVVYKSFGPTIPRSSFKQMQKDKTRSGAWKFENDLKGLSVSKKNTYGENREALISSH